MLVAQFHSWFMFINPEDQEKFYRGYHPVFCVVYDIEYGDFKTAASTEQHFKFNTWEVLEIKAIEKEESEFKSKYTSIYHRILNITEGRTYMNFDENGKIICNYDREDL